MLKCAFFIEKRKYIMIDFEEELKRFQPIMEIEELEELVYNQNLTDMTDIMKEMIEELKNED